MARQTSAQAYQKIKDDGLLSRVRLKVYVWLYQNGPATAGVVGEGIDYNRNNTATRLSELRDLGVVRECGTQKDPTTDMEVILWDVTDQLPVAKLIRKSATRSRKQLLAEIEYLKDLLRRALTRIEELKAKVP